MPERRFDASGFRSARVLRAMTQAQVAAALGIKDQSVVSRYESGDASPPAEKLPRLAALVGERLDDLFPRPGLPTLADLRCDAGMTQKDTTAVTQTGSPSPVRAAEGGRRKLAPHYVAPLAEAYGVSVEELLAAERRSFGEDVPAAPQHPQVRQPVGPQSIARKITALLEGASEQERPTDTELAELGNARAGRTILSGPLVTSLRLGRRTHAAPKSWTRWRLPLTCPPCSSKPATRKSRPSSRTCVRRVSALPPWWPAEPRASPRTPNSCAGSPTCSQEASTGMPPRPRPRADSTGATCGGRDGRSANLRRVPSRRDVRRDVRSQGMTKKARSHLRIAPALQNRLKLGAFSDISALSEHAMSAASRPSVIPAILPGNDRFIADLTVP